MTQLFANNAVSKLAGAVASGAVSLTLKTGDGAKFPTPSGGDFFLVTLYQKAGQDEINHEIVKCTARAGDVLTVMRAQEGTAARAFSVDDPVELRLTAGALATIALDRGTQTYTTSQVIPKSTFGTATYVLVELWAGGASGGAIVSTTAGINERSGGEGGEYVQALLRVASLAASEPLVIGSGGAAVVSTSNAPTGGNPGGNTSFAGVVALGGLVGSTQEGPSKNYLAGKNGGDGGGTSPSTKSITSRLAAGPGGSSVNGGGGGGGSPAAYNAPGTSKGGGNGGAGLTSATSPAIAGSGAIPSGGGGGVRLNLASGTATSGAGALGQARLTWW